jgi:hypothetical protein
MDRFFSMIKAAILPRTSSITDALNSVSALQNLLEPNSIPCVTI